MADTNTNTPGKRQPQTVEEAALEFFCDGGGVLGEHPNVDREKTLAQLKKAAGSGAFGSVIGKASDLRTQLTVDEAHLSELKQQVEAVRATQKQYN